MCLKPGNSFNVTFWDLILLLIYSQTIFSLFALSISDLFLKLFILENCLIAIFSDPSFPNQTIAHPPLPKNSNFCKLCGNLSPYIGISDSYKLTLFMGSFFVICAFEISWKFLFELLLRFLFELYFDKLLLLFLFGLKFSLFLSALLYDFLLKSETLIVLFILTYPLLYGILF